MTPEAPKTRISYCISHSNVGTLCTTPAHPTLAPSKPRLYAKYTVKKKKKGTSFWFKIALSLSLLFLLCLHEFIEFRTVCSLFHLVFYCNGTHTNTVTAYAWLSVLGSIKRCSKILGSGLCRRGMGAWYFWWGGRGWCSPTERETTQIIAQHPVAPSA